MNTWSVILVGSSLLMGSIVHADKPLPVSLATVKTNAEQSLAWFNATVISRQHVELSTEQSGRIDWLAEFGQHVRKGEVLARLDDSALQLRMSAQRVALKRARQQQAYRSQELKRLQSLRKNQGVSQNQLDQAEHDFKLAVIDVEEQQVALAMIEDDIDKSSIYAPFDGVVDQLHAQPGEFVGAGDALITLVNPRVPEVRVFAPIDLVNSIQATQSFPLRHMHQKGSARLLARAYSAEEQSHLLELRLLPEKPENWNIGQALQVAIARSLPGAALSIPRDALVVDQQGQWVFKLITDNQVEKIPVQVQTGNAQSIIVSGELSEGDQVVVRGSGRLKNGDTVDPVMP